MLDPIEARLAARLAGLRIERGWSLEQLAAASAISRATLSRLERGETSPTAGQLGRLCAAYGRTLSSLIAEIEPDGQDLMPRAGQPAWTDPETGLVRRSVSPPTVGYRVELVECLLPAGAVIHYPAPPIVGLEHHLWVLEGRLELTLDGIRHPLAAGDCLRYRLTGSSQFEAPVAARYVIALSQP
jgi:transcriptional regulator with XRE-family HTH domain